MDEAIDMHQVGLGVGQDTLHFALCLARVHDALQNAGHRLRITLGHLLREINGADEIFIVFRRKISLVFHRKRDNLMAVGFQQGSQIEGIALAAAAHIVEAVDHQDFHYYTTIEEKGRKLRPRPPRLADCDREQGQPSRSCVARRDRTPKSAGGGRSLAGNRT